MAKAHDFKHAVCGVVPRYRHRHAVVPSCMPPATDEAAMKMVTVLAAAHLQRGADRMTRGRLP